MNTPNAVKVTVSDAKTGEVLEERELSNDYMIITAGNRYIKHLQVMGKTHVLSVAVLEPIKEEGMRRG